MDCTEYLKLLWQELLESFNHLPTLGMVQFHSSIFYCYSLWHGSELRNETPEVTGPLKEP